MTPLRLDPGASALVVVDLQKGIVRIPTFPRPPGEVVERAARLAEAFRARGGFVVLVHVQTSPDGKDMLRPTADAPMAPASERPPDWSDLLSEMGPKPGDHVVTKRQWGAFYGTDLDLELRRRGIRTLVLCGIATNLGVESTARDAFERGYDQVFVEDAMAARSLEEHRHAVKVVFPRIGRVRATDEVIASLVG